MTLLMTICLLAAVAEITVLDSGVFVAAALGAFVGVIGVDHLRRQRRKAR